MDVKHLYEEATNLFSKRGTLMSMWQEMADNFYPQRADFTFRRTIGQDWAGNLTTSYPILTARELSDQIGTMLRPTAKEWFHTITNDPRREDNEAKRWLQWAEQTQRRAMYDRTSGFTRATKEGDADFSAFGQTVISVQLNSNKDGLLYRCWHLRDVVWMENMDGKICCVFRKWKPGCRELKNIFKDKVHRKVDEQVGKTPFLEIECLHMMVEMDMYDGEIDTYDRGPEGYQPARRKANSTERERFKWVSIHYDVLHEHVMEVRACHNKEYVIPRWQTISGSQYAYSPATIAALPEARLLQAMTYTLLEAGEKATNPPMIATIDAVRSDVAIYASGITWVDRDYDEKQGEALRPITQDLRGLPIGVEMNKDSRQMIAQAFFLNKLTLPIRAPEMTAYEVGQRIQEYIRGALPLFEPMEYDYNGGICEETFQLGMRAGLFGSPQDLPKSLRGAEINFRFESPLHDAIEAQKGQKFLEVKALLADAVALDPTAQYMLDVKVALRDAMNGVGVPAKWIPSEADVEAAAGQAAAHAQAAQLLQTLQQGATVADTLGSAQKNMAQAQPAA